MDKNEAMRPIAQAKIAFVIYNAWNGKKKRFFEDKLEEVLKEVEVTSPLEDIEKQKLNEFIDIINERNQEEERSETKKETVKGLLESTLDQAKMYSNQILEENKEDSLIEYAEVISLVSLIKGLKTNQIRRFLDTVNRLDNKRQREGKEGFGKIKGEVIFLKPQISYAAGRQKNEVKPLMEVLSPCIDKVWGEKDNKKSEEYYKKLVRFIEAIVAYHKFYGGN